MKIKLDLIKPSPNPIRKTWDEDKMNELAQSIKEQGLIVPIKVRPTNNSHYEIVYGHRRVEASRRAGLSEIPIIIEGMDDANALKQALTENVVREDMNDVDKGDALNAIKEETGETWEVIGSWYGMSYQRVSELSVSARSGAREILQLNPGITAKHYREARAGTGNEDDAVKVLTKAAKEELSKRKTRIVAEAYRDAPISELKEKVLKASADVAPEIVRAYKEAPTPEVRGAVVRIPLMDKDTAADILRRSINRVEMDTGMRIQKDLNVWEKEQEERRTMQEWDFAVKEFLDATRLYAEVAKKTIPATKYGKFTPEAARFAIRKAQGLIDELKNLIEELETIT